GVDLDLDLVPSRGELEAHEYLLSESQERMLMVVKAGKEKQVLKIFEKWNLQARAVGKVTDTKVVRIFHKGKTVVEVPPKALTDYAPVYKRKSKEPKQNNNEVGPNDLKLNKKEIQNVLVEKLKQPNSQSKSWVYKQFDQQVQLNSVKLPGAADAAVLRLRKANGNISNKGLAVTLDCNPKYIKANPFLGAQIAMAEAARNIASVGATPLAITDNLNFGNPERPKSFWYLEQATNGIVEGCKQLDTPVVGGNVSLYNEYAEDKEILPTPVIGMVGLLEDVTKAVDMSFVAEGDEIWLVGETFNENDCPGLDWAKEKDLHKFLIEHIQSGDIKSCHDLSEGGLIFALVDALVASNGLSAEVELERPVLLRLDSLLFGESQSRAIFTTSPGYNFEDID
ncbi:MAG TPA: AIR synthase related protein, partial [Vampirovibrionales bacterium]